MPCCMAENVEGGGTPLETSGYLSDICCSVSRAAVCVQHRGSFHLYPGKRKDRLDNLLLSKKKHTTRLRCSFHVSASLQSDITVLVDLHLCPPPAGRMYRHPSVSFLLFPCLHLPASDLCCCLCIKGVEEVCHLRLLPADPFIYFKQRKAQRITVGGFQTSSFLRGSPSLLGPGLCF